MDPHYAVEEMTETKMVVMHLPLIARAPKRLASRLGAEARPRYDGAGTAVGRPPGPGVLRSPA